MVLLSSVVKISYGPRYCRAIQDKISSYRHWNLHIHLFPCNPIVCALSVVVPLEVGTAAPAGTVVAAGAVGMA